MKQVPSSQLKNTGKTIDDVIAAGAAVITRAGREVVAMQEIGQFRADQHELQMLRQAVAYLNVAVTGADWPGDKTTLALPVQEMVKRTTDATLQAQQARADLDQLWAQVGRLVHAITGDWPGSHALTVDQMLDLTERAVAQAAAVAQGS